MEKSCFMGRFASISGILYLLVFLDSVVLRSNAQSKFDFNACVLRTQRGVEIRVSLKPSLSAQNNLHETLDFSKARCCFDPDKRCPLPVSLNVTLANAASLLKYPIRPRMMTVNKQRIPQMSVWDEIWYSLYEFEKPSLTQSVDVKITRKNYDNADDEETFFHLRSDEGISPSSHRSKRGSRDLLVAEKEYFTFHRWDCFDESTCFPSLVQSHLHQPHTSSVDLAYKPFGVFIGTKVKETNNKPRKMALSSLGTLQDPATISRDRSSAVFISQQPLILHIFIPNEEPSLGLAVAGFVDTAFTAFSWYSGHLGSLLNNQYTLVKAIICDGYDVIAQIGQFLATFLKSQWSSAIDVLYSATEQLYDLVGSFDNFDRIPFEKSIDCQWNLIWSYVDQACQRLIGLIINGVNIKMATGPIVVILLTAGIATFCVMSRTDHAECSGNPSTADSSSTDKTEDTNTPEHKDTIVFRNFGRYDLMNDFIEDALKILYPRSLYEEDDYPFVPPIDVDWTSNITMAMDIDDKKGHCKLLQRTSSDPFINHAIEMTKFNIRGETGIIRSCSSDYAICYSDKSRRNLMKTTSESPKPRVLKLVLKEPKKLPPPEDEGTDIDEEYYCYHKYYKGIIPLRDYYTYRPTRPADNSPAQQTTNDGPSSNQTGPHCPQLSASLGAQRTDMALLDQVIQLSKTDEGTDIDKAYNLYHQHYKGTLPPSSSYTHRPPLPDCKISSLKATADVPAARQTGLTLPGPSASSNARPTDMALLDQVIELSKTDEGTDIDKAYYLYYQYYKGTMPLSDSYTRRPLSPRLPNSGSQPKIGAIFSVFPHLLLPAGIATFCVMSRTDHAECAGNPSTSDSSANHETKDINMPEDKDTIVFGNFGRYDLMNDFIEDALNILYPRSLYEEDDYPFVPPIDVDWTSNITMAMDIDDKKGHCKLLQRTSSDPFINHAIEMTKFKIRGETGIIRSCSSDYAICYSDKSRRNLMKTTSESPKPRVLKLVLKEPKKLPPPEDEGTDIDEEYYCYHKYYKGIIPLRDYYTYRPTRPADNSPAQQTTNGVSSDSQTGPDGPQLSASLGAQPADIALLDHVIQLSKTDEGTEIDKAYYLYHQYYKGTMPPSDSYTRRPLSHDGNSPAQPMNATRQTGFHYVRRIQQALLSAYNFWLDNCNY
ncbi:hypothetical protein HOLleu_06974 [Holothuria leucospilota]|uniref:Uncharacterized protein n=1 Tax=Holothuria leucospilota TaxID=206669 RepID=A0A9Q1CND9_HOLLE|nr:hypothetical protein HOLleu_06974 [Holothuria leucospilota]